MRYARWIVRAGFSFIFVATLLTTSCEQAAGPANPAITVSSFVPSELNPPFVSGPPAKGGAPMATPEQAAAFAWQEFIALNWPAGPERGQPGDRDRPSSTCHFADPSLNCALLVWETFRGKTETFPGDGNPPPGYQGSNVGTSWGYDHLPQYDYSATISACNAKQSTDATPWINLDETDQITLDSMYAGVVQPSSSPGNSQPQLIRFLAKSNRTQYVYAAQNQWWFQIPSSIVSATKTYLATKKASPPAGSASWVSLPDGAIEVKAAWRPLNPSELRSGRFHTQMVRFYEGSPTNPCYRDAIWGLVALHIIQKTPSAPYFVYATFEQADNILTASGQLVEDADGNTMHQPAPAAATSPQVCLIDPKPTPPGTMSGPSISGTVILTDDPKTCGPSQSVVYCGSPGSQLYYRNTPFAPPNTQPSAGNICVNRRANAIPAYVITANRNAHAAIAGYLGQNHIKSAPWLYYKLINVQYYPFDKIPNSSIPNGSPYSATPPYTVTNPAPSSFYQANIVVETNRSLQLFSGGLSPNISTDWNQNDSLHKNMFYNGRAYNMGGCMGCHGSRGQNPDGLAGDFSVILADGGIVNALPEVPAPVTSQGMTAVPRNRTLMR